MKMHQYICVTVQLIQCSRYSDSHPFQRTIFICINIDSAGRCPISFSKQLLCANVCMARCLHEKISLSVLITLSVWLASKVPFSSVYRYSWVSAQQPASLWNSKCLQKRPEAITGSFFTLLQLCALLSLFTGGTGEGGPGLSCPPRTINPQDFV